ncbi:Wd repeat-containing protein 44-like [Thalictrum thalictroides]|uniref:Wd repeat-containing protein 44-like n=1 Tax=Thalictrum thalictroides TaxID=46969 RepID=A0A7J6UX05_THATH|nr:Wd repeat-containing protein 44-like [Thalictrum thalictroides]
MLKSNDGDDLFYDSVDSFRSCDSLSPEESPSQIVELDYRIWKSEPVSVLERRNRFLQGMGFNEFVPPQVSHSEEIIVDKFSSGSLPKNFELERIAECSSAVTRFSPLTSNRGEGEASCSGRDLNEETKFVTYQLGKQKSREGKTCDSEQPTGLLPNAPREATAHGEEHIGELNTSKMRIKSWWNRIVQKRMKERIQKTGGSSMECTVPSTNRMNVRHNAKKCLEFSAVYMQQQIQAHKGFIWTMKFSPDGQYLASGGEDGVVRIWHVTSTDASSKNLIAKDASTLVHKARGRKLLPGKKRSKSASVVIPQKAFKIDESPIHEFYGHTDDVLDICWSKSNCLLSSSKDETVRLWQVGSDECLQVFPHNNYVTCIQFNPIDDGFFISGSIDGKVRIWGLSENRVVDWADVRDIITAICYQPDGQGFVVGSISGHCRFYDTSGNNLQLDAQISVQGKKKSSNSRITGFQFSPEDAQKVMITSADSKVRIFYGLDVVHKYRGLRKSGSQMSASFTSNGSHIISVGEDSRVYMWNYDGLCTASSKQAKSTNSCEHFFFEGVSVAAPWLGMEHERMDSNLESSAPAVDPIVSSSLLRDSARFSLGGWFSMDGRLRGLATWPEEKLPLWSVPVQENDHSHQNHNDNQDQDHPHPQDHHKKPYTHKNRAALSSTWGLVIVTGGYDGVIRTFHNYGLPVRL